MEESTFQPDVLIIPGTVAFDEELQPLDAKVYGIIYWLEHLKDGRCFASNATIAKLANSSSSGVRQSLYRLEDRGYITMSYTEKNKRTGIQCLVNMRKGVANETGGVSEMRHRDNNTKREDITSETQQQIKKIYSLYLIGFKIDPHDYAAAPDEDKPSLLQAASKRYRLTDQRRNKIIARLKDAGYSNVARAIRNVSKSDFHRGINDREWSASLEWICDRYERIEEWANKTESHAY